MKNTCCVDFISAAHVNCDFLVKYGQSCRADRLENNIPVMYVFGQVHELNLEEISEKIVSLGNTGYVRQFQ